MALTEQRLSWSGVVLVAMERTPVRVKGTIAAWNNGKGFGFISPLSGGERVFVHIKAFADRARRPNIGDVVTYSPAVDERGRSRAENVSIAGVSKAAGRRRSSNLRSYLLPAGFLLIVLGTALVSAIPLSVLLVYLSLSAATFAAYALDKSAAEIRAWRISESTLHLLSLAGGWPGALLAQSRLRHKTKKRPFRSLFWATVVLNCGAFVWLLTPGGAEAYRTVVSAIA